MGFRCKAYALLYMSYQDISWFVMPEIEIKNTVKLFTVLMLSEKGQHGYEIIKEVEKRLGKKPSPGQIYPFLKKLEQYRYVECAGRAERDKKTYHLTPEGREFVSRLSSKLGDLFEMAIKPKLTVCVLLCQLQAELR